MSTVSTNTNPAGGLTPTQPPEQVAPNVGDTARMGTGLKISSSPKAPPPPPARPTVDRGETFNARQTQGGRPESMLSLSAFVDPDRAGRVPPRTSMESATTPASVELRNQTTGREAVRDSRPTSAVFATYTEADLLLVTETEIDVAALEAELAALQPELETLKAQDKDAHERMAEAMEARYQYYQATGRYDTKTPIKSFGDFASRMLSGVKSFGKTCINFIKDPGAAFRKAPEPMADPGPARLDDGTLLTTGYVGKIEERIQQLTERMEDIRHDIDVYNYNAAMAEEANAVDHIEEDLPPAPPPKTPRRT